MAITLSEASKATPMRLEDETCGTPVVLAPKATVADPELDASNYSGSYLTLVRSGGANAEDQFGATGTLASLAPGSNTLVVGGVVIGSVTTNSGGVLRLDFNTNATNALVNSTKSPSMMKSSLYRVRLIR